MATNNAVNLKSSGIVSYDGAGTFSALANPLTVSNGGTGIATNTAYTILCAGTTSTGNLQNVSSVGTQYQSLISAGASSLPAFGNPNGFVFTGGIASFNPADSTTYYLTTATALTASGPRTQYYINQNCTLTICYGLISVIGTLGSNENTTFAIYKNGSLGQNISTTVQLTSSTVTFNNTSMSLSLTAGDYIEFVMTCPAWATNPTSVIITLSAYFI